MDHKIHDITTINERDQDILVMRAAALDAIVVPKVGDWVIFADRVERRISHIWDWHDDDPGFPLAQTSDGGSWYMGEGYCSFSGSLHPSVHVRTFTLTDERRLGWVWFFHHDRHQAHNGVDVEVEFPVWQCSEPAPR